ncbi:hypothetical protein AURDEDRAFT_113557 [Auricularia subglabra TFB-10046 SS5]|nr:hypothetical protein AURDEDRAFT_113557 [Auricularia subglabra TFB-10046 SS5]
MDSASSSTLASSYMSASQPTRHPHYYIDDGNVVLLVGSVLFRLHRSILSRNSAFFRSMLSLPQAPETTEGTVDEDPILLGDLSPGDFELLLDMLYTSPTASQEKALPAWKAILDVAHKLDIEWIHERAFQEMARFPLDPVDKVEIAQRFDDKRHWVREAYVAIVRRETYLSIEEAQRIGLVDSTKLAQARELFRTHIFQTTIQSNNPIPQPQRGGVLRRATTGARHAPYPSPQNIQQQQYSGLGQFNIIQQQLQQLQGPPQQVYAFTQGQAQAGPSSHSVAHGLAAGLAPATAIAQFLPQQQPPQQPPPLAIAQAYNMNPQGMGIAAAITQPARMLMPAGTWNPPSPQFYDDDQAVAERIVDMVFDFGDDVRRMAINSA